MHTSLPDRIRPVLEEVWRSQGRLFASFESIGTEGAWVQYLDGELNLAWPFEESPSDRLPACGVALPETVRVLGWWPGENAILAVGDLRVGETADLVHRLLTRVLEADDDEGAECRVRRHG